RLVREKATWISLLAGHGRHAGWVRRVLQERSGRILLSKRQNQRGFDRRGFASSPARELRRIITRLVKRFLSPVESAGCKLGADQDAISVQATLSGFSRAKSIGTEPRPNMAWNILPCRKPRAVTT